MEITRQSLAHTLGNCAGDDVVAAEADEAELESDTEPEVEAELTEAAEAEAEEVEDSGGFGGEVWMVKTGSVEDDSCAKTARV